MKHPTRSGAFFTELSLRVLGVLWLKMSSVCRVGPGVHLYSGTEIGTGVGDCVESFLV